MFDDDKELGSIHATYKEATKSLPKITFNAVKLWFSKQQHKRTQCKYTGANAYVANHDLQHFEIDLIDMTGESSQNSGYIYVIAGVDMFSKYGWAKPIKTKHQHYVSIGFKERLNSIGMPEILYSDSEGSFTSTECIQFIDSKIVSTSLPIVMLI